MSMQVTRCPHCRTSFRVRAEQLNVAGGAVRCGSCLQVFKAAEHFITNEEHANSVSSTSRSAEINSTSTNTPLAETTADATPRKSASKVLQFTLPADDEDEDLDKVLSSSANAEDAASFDLADVDDELELEVTPEAELESSAESLEDDVFSAHDQAFGDADPIANNVDDDVFSAISDDMDDPFGDDDADAEIPMAAKGPLPPVVDPRVNKVIREGDILIHDDMDLDDLLIDDDADDKDILNADLADDSELDDLIDGDETLSYENSPVFEPEETLVPEEAIELEEVSELEETLDLVDIPEESDDWLATQDETIENKPKQTTTNSLEANSLFAPVDDNINVEYDDGAKLALEPSFAETPATNNSTNHETLDIELSSDEFDDMGMGLVPDDQRSSDNKAVGEISYSEPERFDDFNAAKTDDEFDQLIGNAAEFSGNETSDSDSKYDSENDFDFLLDEIAQEAANGSDDDGMFFEESGSSPAHAMIDFDDHALDDTDEDILKPINRYNNAESATDDADSWALNLLQDDEPKSSTKRKNYMDDIDGPDESVFDDLDAPFNRQQSAFATEGPHVDEYHTQGIDDDDLDQYNDIEEIDYKDNDNFQLGGDIELASQSLEFDLPPPSLASLSIPSTKQKVRRNGLWALGALVLAVTIAAQVAYFRFDTGARSATFRPMYAQACVWLKCQLPSLQNVRNMATQHLVVRPHPDLQNALVVDTLLINNASQQQPFPDLVLEFKDLNDAVLASRRFQPSEYLAGELAGEALMPAGIPIHIGFEIVHPGAEAVSYQIRILANQ